MHAGPVYSDAHRQRLRGALAVAATLLLAAPAFAQRGAMTVPRDLQQMSERAADIIRGTVVSARVEKHPELTNLDTVVVTLRVRETVMFAMFTPASANIVPTRPITPGTSS